MLGEFTASFLQGSASVIRFGRVRTDTVILYGRLRRSPSSMV